MNYLTMDLETTGINTLTDEPVQIALLAMDKDYKIIEEVSYYVNTSVEIHPKAEAVHKISRELLDIKGIRCYKIANIYHDIIWAIQPVTLIGYNLINFDFPMWQNFLSRHKEGMFKHPPIHHIVDVMHLGSCWLNTRKWLKLRDLATALKIPFSAEELHDALADVKLTWECYKKLKEIKL